MSNDTRPHGDADQHIVLVAFDVFGLSMEEAQVRLARGLENVIDRGLADSWWIAEDERYDGSDNDSAVFVPKGSQTAFARLVADERGAIEAEVALADSAPVGHACRCGACDPNMPAVFGGAEL